MKDSMTVLRSLMENRPISRLTEVEIFSVNSHLCIMLQEPHQSNAKKQENSLDWIALLSITLYKSLQQKNVNTTPKFYQRFRF